MVRRPSLRLLTLTGPGGSGKTLLALHAGTTLLADFADGTFAVALSATNDPSLVPAEIADALGVKESGDQSLIPRLVGHLREKRLLLVLDNLEHLRGASKVISTLIENCPALKVLATSRAPLRMRGEYTFHVPPLPVPDPTSASTLEGLLACPAVSLFEERAKAIKSDFVINEQNAKAVGEICALLDGLPLAIELAAARVKLLSPTAMLARLVGTDGRLSLQMLTGGAHDLPERQQTIRGAIAWSYDLLNADLKKLFCRLSVFAGGCTFSTAEAVCPQIGELKIEVLDGIGALVDNNLLRQEEEVAGEPRVSMLQTIREFGLEQLRKSRADVEITRPTRNISPPSPRRRRKIASDADDSLWAQRTSLKKRIFARLCHWSFTNAPELALQITAAVATLVFAGALGRAARELRETGAGSPEWPPRMAGALPDLRGPMCLVSGDSALAESFSEKAWLAGEQSGSGPERSRPFVNSGAHHHRGRNSEARELFDRALHLAQELKMTRHRGRPCPLADLAAADSHSIKPATSLRKHRLCVENEATGPAVGAA